MPSLSEGVDLRRTLLCYGMIGCQSASGIWFLIAYQTYFLQQGGVTKPFEYTIMTSCVGFIGVNVGMFAMRHLVSCPIPQDLYKQKQTSAQGRQYQGFVFCCYCLPSFWLHRDRL